MPPSPRTDKLCAMLRAGNYLDVACRAAGVRANAVERLLVLGGPIADRIAQAAAEGEVRAVTQIAQAAATNWQAAAWLLERQHPERWSRPAVKQDDRLVTVAADGLDELASKRAARRGTA